MLVVERLDGRCHDRKGFDCNEPSLNRYLAALATRHRRASIAATHVLVADDDPSHILGFYTLAAGQVPLDQLQADDRRKLPA